MYIFCTTEFTYNIPILMTYVYALVRWKRNNKNKSKEQKYINKSKTNIKKNQTNKTHKNKIKYIKTSSKYYINIREHRMGNQNRQSRETGNRWYTTLFVTQITYIRHELSYKQLEVKTNWTLFVCGNRSGHHNTGLRT